MNILILASLLISSITWAIPENELHTAWNDKALPYFQSMTTGQLKNAHGLKLKYFYKVTPGNERSIVIVPGRSEPAIKYAELIYDLKDSGFDFFILDHQGQGESTRRLPDSHKGHVEEFKHYVNDFEYFINQVVMSKSPSNNPVYLIAHSMGGAITTHYMSQHPGVFKKAVLVAPMMEMNTAPYSETTALYYSKLLVSTGKGNDYAPDYGPYKPEEDTFEKNFYTHSEARFNISKFIFTNWTSLTVGGPTARWVHESLKATKNIDKLNVAIPIMIFQSGLDQVVKPGRQNSFCKKGKCEIIHIPDAHHEILMEKDLIRDEVLSNIKSFFGI